MNRRSFTQRLALFVLGCQLPFVPLRKADEFAPKADPLAVSEAQRQFREIIGILKVEIARARDKRWPGRWPTIDTAKN